MSDFSKRLFQLRTDKGWTQGTLSKKSGVCHSTIQKLYQVWIIDFINKRILDFSSNRSKDEFPH